MKEDHILNIDNIISDENIPSNIFCMRTIGFTILYVVIGMVLVYRLAPKTFRIRG